MLALTRTLACTAGPLRPDGRRNSVRSAILHRQTTQSLGLSPRCRKQAAGRPLRFGVSCTASYAANNDRPASPRTAPKFDLRRLAAIVELAVLPVGCILLWRAASLPIEALLCAAYWGLQIAMPVPLLRKLGLGLNTSLAASAAVVGAMWTAIYRYLLCPCSLTPLTARTELTFHIPDVVWERICASAWTKNVNVYTTPFRLMNGAERLVLLLPVLLSAAMIGALLLVHKKVQARGGDKTAVVAEPVSEPASDDMRPTPRPHGALPPVSGWPFPCFGGGAGFGLGGSIPLPEIPLPTSGEDQPAEQHDTPSKQTGEAAEQKEWSEENHPGSGKAKHQWIMAPDSASAVHQTASVESSKAAKGQEAGQVTEEAASPAVGAADQLDAPAMAKEGVAERVVALSVAAEHNPNEELRRLARTESSDLVDALLLMSQRVAVLEKRALQNEAIQAPKSAEASEEKLKQVSSEMEAFLRESRERMDSWEKVYGKDPDSLERISAIMETVQTQGEALLAKGNMVDDLAHRMKEVESMTEEHEREAAYLNVQYEQVEELLPKLEEGLQTLAEQREGSELLKRLEQHEGRLDKVERHIGGDTGDESWVLALLPDRLTNVEHTVDALVGHMGNRVTEAELESKLQALEGDNSLAQRLAALEGSLEHLKGNQAYADSQVEEALSEIQELKKQGSAETDTDIVKDAKGDLEERLAEFVTQKEVEDQLQCLLEGVEMARRVIGLEQNVEVLEKFQASTEEQLEGLVSGKDLEERLAPLEADVSALQDAKDDLEERLGEDYLTQDELLERLEDNWGIADVAEKVSDLEVSLASLKEEQGDLEDRLDSNASGFQYDLDERLEPLEKKVENLHVLGVAVREFEHVKIEFEERMSALEKDSPLGAALEELQERLDDLEHEEGVVDRLRSLEADLAGLQDGTEEDLKDFEKRLEALEQIRSKNEEYYAMTRDSGRVTGGLIIAKEHLEDRLNAVEESGNMADADIGKLEDRLDLLEADVDADDGLAGRLQSVEERLQNLLAAQEAKLKAAPAEGPSAEEVQKLRELVEKSTLDMLERIKVLQTETSSLASADQVKYADPLLTMEAGADLPGSKPFLDKLKEWTAAHPPTVRIAGGDGTADLTDKPKIVKTEPSPQLAKEWLPGSGDTLPKGLAPDGRQWEEKTFWHATSSDPVKAGGDEGGIDKAVEISAARKSAMEEFRSLERPKWVGLSDEITADLVAANKAAQEPVAARAGGPEEAKGDSLSDQWLAALSAAAPKEWQPATASAVAKAAEGSSPAADSFSVEVQDVEPGTQDDGKVEVVADKAPEASNGLKERPKWVGLPNANGTDSAGNDEEADEFEVEVVDEFSDGEDYSDEDGFDDEEEEDDDDGLSDLDYDFDSEEDEAAVSDEDDSDDERDFYLELQVSDDDSDGEGDYSEGRKDDDDTVG